MKKSVYFKNLDGLRFIAFLSVFISHASLFLGLNSDSTVFNGIRKHILINGDVGVSFFFVLSGFLITYLLLSEKEDKGSVSLKNFYIRRVLRIWPVYFITIIVGFFILPLIIKLIIGGSLFPFAFDPKLNLIPQFLLFLANFSLAFSGGSSVPTDVLWSISVEEQFYLIWPFIVSILPRKHLLKFLYTVILASCIYRYIHSISPNIIAYSTLSVMSDLAIGSILGIFVYTKSNIITKIKNTPRYIISSVYILLFILVFGRHLISDLLVGNLFLNSIFVSIFPILLTVVYSFIILDQNFLSNSLFKIGESKIISFLGKISYGLYSYHMFAFSIVLLSVYKLGLDINYTSIKYWLVISLSSLIVSIAIASISYFLIEKPLLKYKPK